MRLINVGLGNQGEVLKLWVLNKKEKNPLKETIEVRANLIPLLEFVFSKLKNVTEQLNNEGVIEENAS